MTRSSSLAMRRCFKEPRTEKYFKGYGLLPFARKYKKQLLDTGIDVLKTVLKKYSLKQVNFLEIKSQR